MGTFLTNHHKMMAEFSWDTPPPCSCSSFREKHPNIGGVNHPEDGRRHVASPLDALHVSKRLRFLLGTSAKTQVYPALSSYIEETWAEGSMLGPTPFCPECELRRLEDFRSRPMVATCCLQSHASFIRRHQVHQICFNRICCARSRPCSEPPAHILSPALLEDFEEHLR